MHPNPVFRDTPQARNVAFARERGFATLAVAHQGVPLLSHIPFVLTEDGRQAELHLMRSNPVARAAREPIAATLAVTGPDGYVSPDWYGTPDQVPTWNYVAVHLAGQLVPLPQEDLHAMLDRLSAHFEAVLAPKRPWSSDKMSPGVMERMMRAILPFRFDVAEIHGTWKLNQNKTLAARTSAADHVGAYGIGQDTALLAALMHAVGEGSSP